MFHDAPMEAAVRVHRKTAARESITNKYRLAEVVEFLLDRPTPLLHTALQFPDDMLDETVAVVRELQSLLHADPRHRHAVKEATSSSSCGNVGGCGCGPTASSTMPNPNAPVSRVFVLADNTFGSCCPDEITAQHYHADSIVHFGEACMSRSSRLPVFYVHEPFALSCGGSASSSSSSSAARPPSTAARVVLGVVARMVVALHEQWSDGPHDGVRVRLTVVGSHNSKKLVEEVEQRWILSSSSSLVRDGVDVCWCGYDGAEESSTPSWLVNGVRVPRDANDENTTATVHHFLFVGPRRCAHPTHLTSIQHYHQYHYTDACREVLERTSSAVPPLSIMDEFLGADVSLVAPHASSCSTTPEEDEVAQSCAVDGWLDAVLHPSSGGLHVLANATAAAAFTACRRRYHLRDYNIEAVRASSAVGILVASLAISGYYETTMLLHKLLRAYGKRSYILYVGHLNEYKLANFIDTVDCFVAVACPNSRSSYFPEKQDGYLKPVVSPAEVLLALTTTPDTNSHDVEQRDAAKYGSMAAYNTLFDYIVEPLQDALTEALAQREGMAAHEELVERQPHALVATSAAGALMAAPHANGALARLYERSYVGLEPRLGETEVQTEVAQGKHGIAKGYTTEQS